MPLRLTTLLKKGNTSYMKAYAKNFANHSPVMAAFLETYSEVKLDKEAVFIPGKMGPFELEFILFKDEDCAERCPLISATTSEAFPYILINVNRLVSDDRSVSMYRAVWFLFHIDMKYNFPVHPVDFTREVDAIEAADAPIVHMVDAIAKAYDPIAMMLTEMALYAVGIEDIDYAVIERNYYSQYEQDIGGAQLMADIHDLAIKADGKTEYLNIMKPLDMLQHAVYERQLNRW